MSERWPDPVRRPLPVGLLTEQDISEALLLMIPYLLEPEDPAFDQDTYAFMTAVRSALIECEEILSLSRIGRELAGRCEKDDEPGRPSEWIRMGEEMATRKIARRAIDQLRHWLPKR